MPTDATMEQDAPTNANTDTPAQGPATLTGAPPELPAGIESFDPLATGLVIAGIILLMGITIRIYRRRATASRVSDAPPREQISEIRRRATASRDRLDSVSADVEELAQRLAAHMDNKAARLERLIEEADDRIARLDRALDGSAAPARGAIAPEPRRPNVIEAEPGDPVNSQIFALADQGVEPMEIAKRLNQHVGKVELILALRRA